MTDAPDFDREAYLARLWAMDDALVGSEFPATSPWWRAEIERFVRSGCRRWVIRAGRRGGKSTTCARVAVSWWWFGPWHVPPGDIAVIPFVSVSRDESAARLRTIAALLDALRIKYEARDQEIEVRTPRPALFRTYACSIRSVVGFTSIAIFADEMARWEARDTSANPAREVVGSLLPTSATQRHAPFIAVSSPWGEDDYHAELFDLGEEGDTPQVVSSAPTWIANPTLSEERTHELEPDFRTWQREYAAIPGATISDGFDPEDLAACFRPAPTADLFRRFVATDASSLRGDEFAWLTGGLTHEQELVIDHVDAVGDDDLRRLSMDDVVDRVAATAKRHGTPPVYGDQRESAALQSMFQRRGLRFVSYAWSEPSKDDAMQLLRRLMRERRLILPDHAELRRELETVKTRLLPSGRIRYETSGLDYASCLITWAHAVLAKHYQIRTAERTRWGFHIRGL